MSSMNTTLSQQVSAAVRELLDRAGLQPGDILVVFPEDVHMVKVQLKDACPVKKAVFKVKV